LGGGFDHEVALHRARLVLGWVTVSGVQLPLQETPYLSRPMQVLRPASNPGQLSLAIPPWLDAMRKSQRVVMLCGCGVKAGMVRVWVPGKTVIL